MAWDTLVTTPVAQTGSRPSGGGSEGERGSPQLEVVQTEAHCLSHAPVTIAIRRERVQSGRTAGFAQVTRAVHGPRPAGPPAAAQESFPRFLSRCRGSAWEWSCKGKAMAGGRGRSA
jgi:hypothetical protein